MTRGAGSARRFVAALTWVLLAALPVRCWAWGGATHHYIAEHYSQHLPAWVDGLRAWDTIVDQKVNDPDIRRPTTPGESYRHYIDIDTYPEFLAGTLPHDRATLEARYGAGAVLNHGILPWAVGEVTTTLTQQFAARQWSAAATTIADLCHYVGDSTQPLHCTRNFDGQFSGASGIHARYETNMMEAHLSDLHTVPMPVTTYADPVEAMFGIISDSWADVDTLLQAEFVATTASGGVYDATYYDALWAGTESVTRNRIDVATLATASFVYTAWVRAGEPAVPGSSASVPPNAEIAGAHLEAGPSPFRDAAAIRFGAGTGPVRIDVYDVSGARVERVADRVTGDGRATWRPGGGVRPGLYFVRLSGPGVNLVRRLVLAP